MTLPSVEVRNCKVRCLDHWSDDFDDEVRFCEDGIYVMPKRHSDKGPLVHVGDWRDIGFDRHGSIVVSRMSGRISTVTPVRITFQYLRGTHRVPALCEVTVRRAHDAVRVLYGFEVYLDRHLTLEDPSAWPLPDLTFSSRLTLSLYTPRVRKGFKLLSKFNHLAMELLLIFSILRLSTQIEFQHIQKALKVVLGHNFQRPTYERWVTVVWFILTRFRGAALVWIGLQKVYGYLQVWHAINRAYRSIFVLGHFSKKVTDVVHKVC